MSFERTPIVAILGKRGSGKTLLLTYLLQHYGRLDGLPVFSNYGVDIPGVECTPMDKEFLQSFFDTQGEAYLSMKGGLIGIDEFPLFLDAYDFKTKKAKIFSYFVLQTRKRNVSLFLTAQQIRLIPIRIRENVDMILEPKLNGTTLEYDIFTYEAPYMEFVRRMRIEHIDRVFPYYDTNQIIQVLDDE